MTDFKFDMDKSMKELRDKLENLAPSLEQEINQALTDTAHAAYATIVSRAQSRLKGPKREAYLRGLEFEDLGDNNYLISLHGDWANSIEDGYGPYDMRETLLKSTKISPSGEPWVKTSKTGSKYAHVPMKKSTSAASSSGNMADAIKQLTAQNAQGRQQRITSLFKDSSGNPLSGKVATAATQNPLLKGLTKYQEVGTDKNGNQRVSSTYILYRTISENGKPWMQPGQETLGAFLEAEIDVGKQIDNILKTLL